MVVFALRVMPDLEDDRAEAAPAPSYCTKLFRVVVLLVNQIHLLEDLLRFFQTDAVFSFDFPALLPIEVEAHPDITLVSSSDSGLDKLAVSDFSC